MITIIHGDDVVSSRNAFLLEKEKTKSGHTFDGTKITLTDIVQVVEGGTLFHDDQKLFIEDFFSKRKESKEITDITTFVKRAEKIDVIFWESKELSRKNISLFPKAQVKTYTLPQLLFTFLDAIRPGNAKTLLLLFDDIAKRSEIELVFYMLVRQFRLLLAVSDSDTKDSIDEVSRLAPWQKNKLLKQAQLFSKEELQTLYQKLYELDKNVKTGNVTLPFRHLIDFFLLGI